MTVTADQMIDRTADLIMADLILKTRQDPSWAGEPTVCQWVAIGLGSRAFPLRTERPASLVVGTLDNIDLQFT